MKMMMNHSAASLISNSSRPSEEYGHEESGIYVIPPTLALFLTMVYTSVSFIAVFGNFMVLWTVIKSKSMRSVTNIFIANIAISDISTGALAIPFQFQAALLQKWILPQFLCSFCPAVQIVSLNVSIFTLIALSYDRHRAITQPLKPYLPHRKAFIIIALIWFLALCLSIPTFLTHKMNWEPEVDGQTGDKIYIPRCRANGLDHKFLRYYNYTLVVLQYWIPFILIFIFYVRIALVLNRNMKAVGDSRYASARTIQSKKNVIKMLLIVITIFAICWFPYQLYNILQEVYEGINQYRYINVIWFACHLFAMSNSCINPFIYAIYSEKFNAEFTMRFYMCCCWSARFGKKIRAEANLVDGQAKPSVSNLATSNNISTVTGLRRNHVRIFKKEPEHLPSANVLEIT